MSRTLATLIGITAVLSWATLGLFTARSGAVPPFLMNALTFGISGAGSMLWLALTGRLGAFRQPLKVWIIGTGGLFGFHALYFTSMRHAPPVEANLVNYTWPLLIVLFSGLLPGERLKAHHILGTVLGLIGAVLIITGGRGIAIEPAHAFGLMAACGSALVWSSYSVISRRMGAVPTELVAGFCLGTAILSGICHYFLETTVLPADGGQWAAVIALGVFPLGLGFFTWDIGVKRGDIQVLGAASYLSPLLSTLFLILDGKGAFTLPILIAALLMTGGALIASKDMILGRKAAAAE